MQVFTTHWGLKLLFVGLAVVMASFALVACFGAWWDPAALLVSGLCGGLAFLLVVVGFPGFRKVEITDEELVYGGLLGSTRVRLDDIERVEPRQALWVHTGAFRVRIRLMQRGKQGAVAHVLRKRVPHAFARPEQLPYRWRCRNQVLGVNLFYVALGLVMGGLGVATVGSGAWQLLHRHWMDGVIQLGMGGLFLVVGFGMVAALLWTTLMWVDFRDGEVVARYPVRWRRFGVDGMTLALSDELRTYRGIARRAWMLDLAFGDGRTLRIEPTENGVPADFAPDADHDELQALERDLSRLYALQR